MSDDILREPPNQSTSMRCAIGPLDSSSTIATLLERDIPMCRMVVGSFTLELHPRRRDQSPSLYPPLKTRRQRDETACLWSQTDRFKRFIEIGPRGPVAVPVIIIKEVRTRLVRIVVQVDAHLPLVVFRLMSFGRGDVFHHIHLLHGRAVGCISFPVTGSGILVAVSDDCVLSPFRRGRLVIIALIAWATVPSPNANISLPVSETADEGFEFGVVFYRAHAFYFALFVEEDAALKIILRRWRGFLPCCPEVLHEKGVPFARGRLALLLDGDVAAGAHDVRDVDEVIATEAVECDLSLFAFVATVQRDDGAG